MAGLLLAGTAVLGMIMNVALSTKDSITEMQSIKDQIKETDDKVNDIDTQFKKLYSQQSTISEEVKLQIVANLTELENLTKQINVYHNNIIKKTKQTQTFSAIIIIVVFFLMLMKNVGIFSFFKSSDN